MWRPVLAIGIVAALVIPGFVAADDADKKTKPADLKVEFYQDFRNVHFPDNNFRLDGTDAATRIKSEQDGLRIILSGEQQNSEHAGVAAYFSIKGDFELTTGFEILNAIPQNKGDGVSFELYLRTNGPKATAVVFCHKIWPDGNAGYFALRMATNDKGNREGFPFKRMPATGKSGLLRVSRSGSDVVLSASEKADKTFHDLYRFDLGTEDVSLLRLAAQPGNAGNVLDVRLLDLRVRENLPNLKDRATGEPTFAAGTVKVNEEPSRKALWVAIFLILGTLALGVVLMAIRHRRTLGLPANAAAQSAEELQPTVHPSEQKSKYITQMPQTNGFPKSKLLLFVIPVILVSLGVGLALWFANRGDDTDSGNLTEFYEDFRNKKIEDLGIKPSFLGAADFMKCEPAGLRITLLANKGKLVETGVLPPVDVHGDFEITAGYEIVKVHEGRNATFEIYLATKSPTNEALALHRVLNSSGTFFGNRLTTNAQGKRENLAGLSIGSSPFRAAAKSGRIRIARQGTEAIMSFADPGQDFQELFRAPLGPEDLAKLRIGINPRNAEFVDLRLVDVRVKGTLASTSKGTAPRGTSLWLVAGLLATVTLIGGVWIFSRKTRSSLAERSHG